MTLFFDPGLGYSKWRVIGHPATREEAWGIMQDFMHERNYKSYYQRIWQAGEFQKIDVGSWSQFFYLDEHRDWKPYKRMPKKVAEQLRKAVEGGNDEGDKEA